MALAHPLDVKSHIGVVPEELSLFERLTGMQLLTFYGRMYGLSGAASAERLMDHVSMPITSNTPVRKPWSLFMTYVRKGIFARQSPQDVGVGPTR